MSSTSITPDRIPAGAYNVDPAHSNVGFEVRHMVGSLVQQLTPAA